MQPGDEVERIGVTERRVDDDEVGRTGERGPGVSGIPLGGDDGIAVLVEDPAQVARRARVVGYDEDHPALTHGPTSPAASRSGRLPPE